MGRAFESRRAAKEKRWDKMSKVFPKLAKAIQLAAREGGGDPTMNSKLRTAIQNAKAENMPKDNIDNAIKRATGKDAQTLQEVTFEGKGPHGVLVFVECTTDNNNRTLANIKSYFNKSGGNFVPSGSLEFMFSRKAFFEFLKKGDMDLEELELSLIDGGLEEIEENDGVCYAYANYSEYGTLAKTLDIQEIEVKKSGLKRIPTNPMEFTEEQLVDIEKMLDKIEDDEDVQAVYTNIS